MWDFVPEMPSFFPEYAFNNAPLFLEMTFIHKWPVCRRSRGWIMHLICGSHWLIDLAIVRLSRSFWELSQWSSHLGDLSQHVAQCPSMNVTYSAMRNISVSHMWHYLDITSYLPSSTHLYLFVTGYINNNQIMGQGNHKFWLPILELWTATCGFKQDNSGLSWAKFKLVRVGVTVSCLNI